MSGRQAFISYASEDARVAVGLCNFLERSGVPCWIAPRDVTPGREYAAEILDGIESSSAFVLLLSAQANRSPFVRRELERAASKDKPLFLVRIEEVEPDRSLELFVSAEHWIDAWSEPVETHWTRLANAIKGERGPRAALPASAPRLPWKTLAAGAGAGVLLTVAVVLGMRSGGDAPTLPASPPAAARPEFVVPAPAAGGSAMAPTAGSGAGAAATSGSAGSAAAAAPAAGTDEPCPPYYAINPELPSPYACRCAPGAGQQGAVWGSDIYTADSALCRAALHAGVISRAGGRVEVERMPGRELYPGTSRNGIRTSDYGPYHPAIHFVGTPLPASPEPCPGYLAINPDLATPYSCSCAPGASMEGAVWGTDIYTADSALCRAAVHAGKLGRDGGTVTVVYADGRATYAGSSRNGIGSADYGAYPRSIRFP